MKRIAIYSIMLLCALSACSGSDDEVQKDMQQPVISDQGITANPIDCQVYHRGETIPFSYVFTDNDELGKYNIEVHHNFDHHTHSTSATTCSMDDVKEAQNPWVFNQDFNIPDGQKSFSAREDIKIPTNIDTGEVRSPYPQLDPSRYRRLAFAGIHVMNPTLFSYFDEFPERFSIIDFYLKVCDRASIYGYEQADLRLLDVGKQDALEEAESFVKSLSEGEGA